MRIVTLIIIHCSATPQGVGLSFEDCRHDHIFHRNLCDIGYRFCLTRDGETHRGHPLGKIGAYCQGHNRHSIGICYEGRLDINRRPSSTHTLPQKASLVALLHELKQVPPNVLVTGHHDLNSTRECPYSNTVMEHRGL